MVVSNRNRTIAIVIRHDGKSVSLVPMRGGKLSAEHLPHGQFVQEWQETPYPLAEALALFQHHVLQQGASQEVIKGLGRLEQRDRCVVASLF